MSDLVRQIVGSVILAAYAAAWWFAVWLVLGRPRLPAVHVVVCVCFLGFGLPTVLDDVAAIAHSDILSTAVRIWMAMPAPILGHLPFGGFCGGAL